MTMTSLMFTPIGSVAISGRPVLETTVSISSGKASRSRFSTSVACWMDSSRDTLGRRSTWSANAPSSSRGMNSAPRKGAASPAVSTATSAATTTAPGLRSPQARTGA